MVVLQIGIPAKEIRNINQITACRNIFKEQVCSDFINTGRQNNNQAIIIKDKEKQHFKYLDLNNLNPAISEIFRKLVTEVNLSIYNFHITHIEAGYLLKNDPKNYSDWYVDLGNDELSTTRKLTALLFLSRSVDYQGGGLSFLVGDTELLYEQGTILIFPSYQLYKFGPVIKGTQDVFVFWACGPAFH